MQVNGLTTGQEQGVVVSEEDQRTHIICRVAVGAELWVLSHGRGSKREPSDVGRRYHWAGNWDEPSAAQHGCIETSTAGAGGIYY